MTQDALLSIDHGLTKMMDRMCILHPFICMVVDFTQEQDKNAKVKKNTLLEVSTTIQFNQELVQQQNGAKNIVTK